jgi:lipoyl-dependent peroxiredoxin
VLVLSSVDPANPRETIMDRHATAVWKGSLKEGGGTLDTQSGAFKGVPYSFKGRFEDESGQSGTNPEELIAAAHAGCFAMALSHALGQAGFTPDELDARADVSIEPKDGGFAITRSRLTLEARVPGIDQAKFKEIAEQAKANCPVSKALAGVEISLDAKLA